MSLSMDARRRSGRRSQSPRPSLGGRERAKEEEKEKREKPNFNLSGKLAAASNTYKGVVLLYHEPAEARVPSDEWRVFVFRGDEQLQSIELTQSCYLLGRDGVVCDILVDHHSCSKQHAVIQFRQTNKRNKLGDVDARTKPYIIDLKSSSGTYLNGEKVTSRRYLELRSKDTLQFGDASREYVLVCA